MILNVMRHARRAIGFIWIAFFVLLVGFALITHVAPLTGRHLFIIIGGSMEPAIPIGSLVVASPTDPMSITPGRVVTIRADNGAVITHRVTRVVDLPDGRYFELMGDANKSIDNGLAPARAIVGTADQYVPYAGYALAFLSKPAGLIATASVLGALFVAYMLLGLLGPTISSTPAQARKPSTP